MITDSDLLSIQQARQLVETASAVEETLKTFTQSQIDRIVESMAGAAEAKAAHLAKLAVEETGYGLQEDKTVKNLFAAVDVYRYCKGLKTCGVISENAEKKTIDIAVPVGVVACIIPSTNPTSTTIFKILAAVKGRNCVVVSPHPKALTCTVETARLMAEAGLAAGAPKGFVVWMDRVTLEGTRELMRHRKTNLILATGGPGLVRAAYSSGKPAFGVGPGNVPSFVERTADISKAVRDIVTGKTFDHGVLCSSEQALVCDSPVEESVVEELKRNGAHFLSATEQALIEKLIKLPSDRLNPEIVGKSPQEIAKMAEFSVPADVRCLVGRPQGVGLDHPLSMEKLSPILAFYVEDGWEDGCERCIEILNFGGLGHTMSIHSNDQRVILEFGLHKPAYRICVNTPATLGAVGLTTGVPPSMTLGCGTPGGNITSDNITPMHLIHIKRLAFETRSAESIQYRAGKKGTDGPESVIENSVVVPADPGTVGSVVASTNIDENPSVRRERPASKSSVEAIVEAYLKNRQPEPLAAASAAEPLAAASAAERDHSSENLSVPEEFVCEDDVRRAVAERRKIRVDHRTILTPSARDLGESKRVLVWAEGDLERNSDLD